MIYTMIVIDDTARVGKLYVGESETTWNKFFKILFSQLYQSLCTYKNLWPGGLSSLKIIVIMWKK
jgi:hypothetical protein